MNHNEMLTMMALLSEKQNWVSGVKAKWKPPVGFFTQDPDTLVAGLLAAPGGKAKAMSRLNFYINRAGEKISAEDKARLETTKDKLTKLKEAGVRMALLAGIVLEDKDDDEPGLDLDDEPSESEHDANPNVKKDKKGEGDDADDKDGKDEVETIEDVYKKLAKQIKETDDEEAIIEFLRQVYEAGKKDEKAAEAEKKHKKEKKKEKDDDSDVVDDKDGKDDADDKEELDVKEAVDVSESAESIDFIQSLVVESDK